MKFCHNRSKKKHSQGLSLADVGRCGQVRGYRKLGPVLAWGLPLVSLLAFVPTAQAQVATSLDWGTGAGDAVEFAPGDTTNTYVNVGGSGVDVRVTVAGAITNNQNQNLILQDSDFVSPAEGTETLLIPISGVRNAEADITIEFLATGTNTPVDVTLASFPIHDLDVLFNNNRVSWQDEVVISATSGGTPVAGITAGGEADPEGTFNQEVGAANSVTITGVNTVQNDNPNAPTQNANSPRRPGLNPNNIQPPPQEVPNVPNQGTTTIGTFEQGNSTVNFANPLDTISLTFRNGPGTQDFASHAISLGDISFTAPAIVAEEPAIGVSKRVISTTTQADGDFEVVYETTVENLGNVALNNVQLTEDLDDTYGEGAFTIIGAPTFTARNLANEVALTPNAGFDADAPNGTPGDTNILVANQTLQVGENSTFRFTVEVDNDQITTPDTFLNQIDAVGTSPNGTDVDDASDDGLETDADGDGTGNEPGENDPTPVQLPPAEAPAIGVSKRVISAETQGDGDFEVVYETTVENLGNTILNNVQLTEDLDDTYGEGAFLIIGAPTFTARNLANEVALTPNPGFDADAPNGTPGDTNILAANQTLQVGENSTFRFTVEIDNDQITTPDTFLNQIEAVGTSPGGINVDDDSDDGVDTDTNPNDGNPGGGPNENDPTPVVLPPRPVIGVAKQVVSSVVEPTGSFGANTARVTYNVVVANIGTVPLIQVQLDEDFNSVYGAGTFQVVGVTFVSGATTVAADATFDGITGSNTTLLADAAGTPTGTLATGASSTFQLVVDVDISNPGLTPALPGPYDNQIEATATDANGNTTSDLSDSGTDVDADGDGEPNEDNGSPPDPDNPDDDGNENTPTRVRFAPDVRLVKRITRVIRNGTEVAIPNIGVFNDQAGDTNDNTLSTLSGNSLPLGLTDISQTLQSGDVVEYTVYFFNAGLGAAENVELCDELQPPSVLQAASLELAQATALSPGGTTLDFSNIGPLSPRAPLSPLEPSCISAPGTFPSGVPAGGLGVGAGGGVVVGGPTSGLDVDAGEVGAFRFNIQLP